MRLLSIPALLLISTAASADPADSPTTFEAAPDSPYTVGARIGGYGFRRDDAAHNDEWNECRMNGVGVFVNRTLRGPVLLEGGLDTYFSTNQAEATDLPIDRQSVLISTAIGVRMTFAPWLRGFVQVGGGVELTRVAVPYGDEGTIRADKAMPEGFIGAGGDIRIARATYLGASIRTLVMGNFTYDPANLMPNQWVAEPTPAQVFSATPTLAAQAQFYLRRDL